MECVKVDYRKDRLNTLLLMEGAVCSKSTP